MSFRTLLSTLALALWAWLPAAVAADDFADPIEHAHGASAWDAQSVLRAEIAVEFGGRQMLEATLWTDTPVGRTRFELTDGTVLVFDGETAWVAPQDASFQGARFHVLTWPYFLAAPMKLDDPGTHVEILGDRAFKDGQAVPAARLTFDNGVGDSPEDWYVLYRDPKTDRLAGMAYIVTFGTAVEKAEEEPHAIVYDRPVRVDGVTLWTDWTFYNWQPEEGVIGDPIGRVTIRNPRFVDPSESLFAAPADARAEAAPAP